MIHLVRAYTHFRRPAKDEIWLTVEHCDKETDEVIIRKVRHYTEDEPSEIKKVPYTAWLDWIAEKKFVEFIPK